MNTNKIKHILSAALTALYITLSVWIAASWGEVIIKNTTSNNIISDYNIFKMIIKLK